MISERRWSDSPVARTSAQAAALRARIMLASVAGRTNAEVAVSLGITPATVGK